MDEPNVEKLRRFALIVGLITLTYSVAGISLRPEAGISIAGLTFKISRPGLLPVGIVLASLYAMLRFYYYGFMLYKSPYSVRRGILDGLSCSEGPYIGGKKIPMYFGPKEFETKLSNSHSSKIQRYIETFPDAFPKLGKTKPSLKLQEELAQTTMGQEVTMYSGKVVIPISCRLAAIVQDIDYSLPVWLNLISLCVFFGHGWIWGVHP